MSDGKHNITFKANPTQKRFIEDRHMGVLWACRMGEGKSAALAWKAWYYTKMNPGAHIAIVRDTWESLRDTTQKEFFKWFPASVFGHYNHTSKTWRWTAEGMSGDITWIGMDDPRDAGKLQSRELALVLLDEAAPAAESGGISEFIFDVALSRLRQPGMGWYQVAIAENNPDENHWTYKRFVEPGDKAFLYFQSPDPENRGNLPPDYYQRLTHLWAHREDLVRRFVRGEFGFQSLGKAVTPEWSDRLHLAYQLQAVRGRPLHLMWDFGVHAACVISQIDAGGHWNILEDFYDDDVGTYSLIEDMVKPALVERYPKLELVHIPDPSGRYRSGLRAEESAVQMIRKALGGLVRLPMSNTPRERIDPLRAVLAKTVAGEGLARVDRDRAKRVWHALRGGWHYRERRTGGHSSDANKNEHSHPGDCMAYGAQVLFPLGQLRKKRGLGKKSTGARSRWFHAGSALGFEQPHLGRLIERQARQRAAEAKE